MLKAVLVDSNAVSRGLLNTVLVNAGWEVVAQTHTSHQGLALVLKHKPHFICVAREQTEDGEGLLEQIRVQSPKTLVFMVSGQLDEQFIKDSLAQGVHGFVVKPFKADAVIKTIRNAVIAVVKKGQT